MEHHLRGATFVLFTDFGADDIYVGQVKAALLRHAPGAIIIDLLHRASTFDPKAGAYLLAALQSYFPKGAVFLAIVDPGVGGLREAIAIEADDIGTSGRITDCCPLSPHAQDDRVKKVVTEYSVAELDALLEITAYEQMSARERFTPEIAAPERSFESSSHWSPLFVVPFGDGCITKWCHHEQGNAQASRKECAVNGARQNSDCQEGYERYEFFENIPFCGPRAASKIGRWIRAAGQRDSRDS